MVNKGEFLMLENIMSTELVQVVNNQAITTSRKVAEVFERNHKDVLKSIQVLQENIEKSMSAEKFAQYFFQESSYIDSSGKSNPEYLMNRDGFSLLVMGFNNTEKVLKWKLQYIETFNRMEEYIKKQKLEKHAYQTELVSKDTITQALMIAGDRANAAAKYLGMEIGMARIHAINNIEDELDVNLESCKRFLPPSEDFNIATLTPTSIASILKEELGKSISAQQVNQLLFKNGYQFKPYKEWIATEKGKKYASFVPFDNKSTGHAGYQLKWKVTVLDVLKELLA